MTITEALNILRASDTTADPFDVTLACGFTPLHVQTLLAAHLQRALPSRAVRVSTGLYGDLAGTLDGLRGTAAHAAAVVLEWPDLDPRLGFREAGRWGPRAVGDIVATVGAGLERIAGAIARIPAGVAVVLSMPTLPLPPVFHTPGWQAGEAELILREVVARTAAQLSRSGVRIVNESRLAEDSPPGRRYSLKSDLLTGLPYTLAHAGEIAAAITRLVRPAPPCKGLITDLDDTLWFGIVGEIGPENVSWDLASNHALHGLYQRLLGALAEEGVLLGVASKNDPDTVRQALQRPDLLLDSHCLFPTEVHWNAKSNSVARILRSWNIAADSVIFVDDSATELAEVAAQHPGIRCIQFPGKDYDAGLGMLRTLRDLFGKDRLSSEDAIRLDSIRAAAQFQAAANDEATPETFLEQLEATVSFEFNSARGEARVLELVNKTNQFNLNGLRYSEADWNRELSHPDAVLVVVSYSDRFGPLGRIAVIQGRAAGHSLSVRTWVMSCRAFARRIEHQCLRLLFDRYPVRQIEMDFAPTRKNGPVQQFLTAMTGASVSGPVVLTRECFEQNCPQLYHRVEEVRMAQANG